MALRLILAALGFAQGRVSAAALEQLGSGSPGIDDMWAQLKQTFPHTDMGGGGLTFFLLLAANFILRFIGGIAVLMIVYGGIRMIMTIADENAHGEAKKIVMYACIGLMLAISADGIVLYVLGLLQMATGG